VAGPDFTLNTSIPSGTFNRTYELNPTTNGTSAIVVTSSSAPVTGTMKAGVTIQTTVRKALTITTTQLGTLNISGTVNGITFSRSRTQTTIGSGQTLNLDATGTPLAAGTFTITTNTTPAIIFSITVSQ